MTAEIVEQTYPALCEACCLLDGRHDLIDSKARGELIRYSKGEKTRIKKEDVEKYVMTWNPKFHWYECNRKEKHGKDYITPQLSAPQDQILFWSYCSDCRKTNLTTLKQEFAFQKIKQDRKLVTEPRRELKTIKTVYWEKNESQEPIECLHCGHKGKKTNQGVF